MCTAPFPTASLSSPIAFCTGFIASLIALLLLLPPPTTCAFAGGEDFAAAGLFFLIRFNNTIPNWGKRLLTIVAVSSVSLFQRRTWRGFGGSGGTTLCNAYRRHCSGGRNRAGRNFRCNFFLLRGQRFCGGAVGVNCFFWNLDWRFVWCCKKQINN